MVCLFIFDEAVPVSDVHFPKSNEVRDLHSPSELGRSEFKMVSSRILHRAGLLCNCLHSLKSSEVNDLHSPSELGRSKKRVVCHHGCYVSRVELVTYFRVSGNCTC